MPIQRTQLALLAFTLLGAGCAKAGMPPTEVHTGGGLTVTLPPPYATPSANNGPNVVPPPAGALPSVPAGYHIAVWTRDVMDPRNIVLSPEKDVCVVESSAGRIAVFPNNPSDYSRPGPRHVLLEGLAQPFGLAFADGSAFVGNTSEVMRFPYKSGEMPLKGEGKKITDLTPGGYRQHWTRNVVADTKTKKLYVSVGSSSNVDVEKPPRASILEMNYDGSGRREFAEGLRNPAGLSISPQTGKLWTAVNERDNLGDDDPPDYVTEVKDGGFYGWPYSYIGSHEDPRRRGERPDLVAKAIVPDVLVGAHVAALNLRFNPGTMLPGTGDIFVATHGSWNRSTRSGYSVLRIPMKNGRPAGAPEKFVTGFILPNDNVWGRPVSLSFLPDGSLLVGEDGNHTIFRVTYDGK